MNDRRPYFTSSEKISEPYLNLIASYYGYRLTLCSWVCRISYCCIYYRYVNSIRYISMSCVK